MKEFREYIDNINLAELFEKSKTLILMRNSKVEPYQINSTESKICENAFKLFGININDWNLNFETLLSFMLRGDANLYKDWNKGDIIDQRYYSELLENKEILELMLIGVPGNIAQQIYNKPNLAVKFLHSYAHDKNTIKEVYKKSKEIWNVLGDGMIDILDNDYKCKLQDILDCVTIRNIDVRVEENDNIGKTAKLGEYNEGRKLIEKGVTL